MANNVTSALDSLLTAGLSFYAPFADAGSGAVSLVASGAGASQAPTFTRATDATTVDENGLIVTVSAGTPRSYYDPTTLEYRGYLAEGARTNLLLNATIDGASLATQNVTVAAVAYTLSFYGTGTVTLSGTSTAGPLVGTGAYPQRVSLTFTPTAGTLTLTVSGDVQFANLEAGTFPSSFIPTEGSAVTRNADVLTYPFSGNADATVGAAYAELGTLWSTGPSNQIAIALGASGWPLYLGAAASTAIRIFDGTNSPSKTGLSAMVTEPRKRASSWGGSTLLITGDGQTPASGTFDGDFNASASFGIGTVPAGGAQWFGTIKNVRIWTRQFSSAQLQAITA